MKFRTIALQLATAGALVAVGASSASAATHPQWLMLKPAVTAVAKYGVTVHPTWEGGVTYRGYADVNKLESDFASGALKASGVKWVLYDVERWSATPVWQQQHPFRAARRAARIAAAAGVKLIVTPAQDLVGSWQHYLSHDLASMARHAQVIDIQAQAQEMTLSAYATFVRKATAQAKAVNPSVIVIAGLTTSYRVGHVTGRALLTAAKSVYPKYVKGFWLNVIPGGNTYAAVWLLKHL